MHTKGQKGNITQYCTIVHLCATKYHTTLLYTCGVHCTHLFLHLCCTQVCTTELRCTIKVYTRCVYRTWWWSGEFHYSEKFTTICELCKSVYDKKVVGLSCKNVALLMIMQVQVTLSLEKGMQWTLFRIIYKVLTNCNREKYLCMDLIVNAMLKITWWTKHSTYPGLDYYHRLITRFGIIDPFHFIYSQ